MRDWLLRLYPRAWRERYAGEVSAMLAAERLTPRLVLDLIAGAVDARLSPQSVVAASRQPAQGGRTVIARLSGMCDRNPGYTVADGLRSAVWIVVVTAGLTWLSIGLMQWLGRSLPLLTLRYAAFPLALLWSSRWTTMKPYSRTAQAVILGATAIVVLAICAVAATIGNR
jgi:hypothetical protein